MRQRFTTVGFGIGAVIAAGAIAFALAVGVGAVTLPGGDVENAAAGNLLASSSTAPDWTSGTGGPGWGRGHGPMGYGPLQALVAANTITADQATKIVQAVRTQHEKTEAAGGQEDATTYQKDIATALDSLVSAGTITADQAAKVKTALANVPMMGRGFGFGGPGMRGFGPGMGGGMGGWGPGPNGANPGASPAPASGSGTTS